MLFFNAAVQVDKIVKTVSKRKRNLSVSNVRANRSSRYDGFTKYKQFINISFVTMSFQF